MTGAEIKIVATAIVEGIKQYLKWRIPLARKREQENAKVEK